MKTGKKVLVMIILLLVSAAGVSGQSTYNSLFALRITPGLGIPIAGDTVYYDMGGAVNISGEFTMPFFPLLFAGVDVGYNYIPTGAPTSLSMMAFGVGIGLDFTIFAGIEHANIRERRLLPRNTARRGGDRRQSLCPRRRRSLAETLFQARFRRGCCVPEFSRDLQRCGCYRRCCC